MEKKGFFVWLSVVFLCLAFVAPCSGKNVNAMTILETDVETASDGCTMLGVYGSYYSQAQDALDRINEIRKEACAEGNVPDPRDPSRMLTMSDYVPVKWSTDLESVARIRAMEAGLTYSFMGSGHNRLNGKGVFSVQFNGIGSSAEDLAYNWGTSMVSGIEQWYEEKSDWVNRVSGTVTGHYTSMIDPSYTYVGLGDFYTEEAMYPNTLAGQFSRNSQNLDQTMQIAQTNVMQKIEVKKSFITGYILEGVDTIYTSQTTKLTLKAMLENGSQKHRLWVLDPVTYTSSDVEVATVTPEGVVSGLKNGTTTITAKRGDTILATVVITIKCNHAKELKFEIPSTCTSTGLKIYSCDICGDDIEQEIGKIAHAYVYSDSDSEGYRTGICSSCGDTIKIIPPTTMTLWWRNSTSESSYYYSNFPGVNPIGSIIYCWPDDVDGDSEYRDIIIESTDESVISVPETVIANSSNNRLKVLTPGITTLTVYAKYNPSLKKTVVVRIGDSGSVDFTIADVQLSSVSYEENGTVRKPTVTVSYHDTVLKQGTDYTLLYEGDVKQGTAAVVIVGKGIFAGTIRKNYSVIHIEHSVVIDEAVNPTCTTDGRTEGSHCSVCGEIIVVQMIVESPSHSWDDEYTIDIPATETTEGSKSIHCSQCNETKDRLVIPATGIDGDNNTGSNESDRENVGDSGNDAEQGKEDDGSNDSDKDNIGDSSSDDNRGNGADDSNDNGQDNAGDSSNDTDQGNADGGSNDNDQDNADDSSNDMDQGKDNAGSNDNKQDNAGDSSNDTDQGNADAGSNDNEQDNAGDSSNDTDQGNADVGSNDNNQDNAGDSSNDGDQGNSNADSSDSDQDSSDSDSDHSNSGDTGNDNSNVSNNDTNNNSNNNNNSNDNINDDAGNNDKETGDEEEKRYPEIGERFEIDGIIYEVTKTDWINNKFEVSCVATRSKNIKRANILNCVEYKQIKYKVVSIGKKAFSGCKKLTTVSIGSEITNIGNQAFYNCIALKKITIPSKVTIIGKSAFQKCKNLKSIIIKTSELKSGKIGKNAFKGIKPNVTIKVPKKKYKDYKAMLKKKGISAKAKYNKL